MPTIQQIFNTEFPAQLVRNVAKARTINASVQLNIVGNGGGSWNIQANTRTVGCTPGTGPATVTMTVSVEDYLTLSSDPQRNSMGLWSSGKVKIDGNPLEAMKLIQLFGLK